jgi:hypothetical protein
MAWNVLYVYMVESDQFLHSGPHSKAGPDPALVMAGITMPVSDRNSNIRYRTSRSAPDGKSIFAGMTGFLVRGSGTAGPESPAKTCVTGAEELVRV